MARTGPVSPTVTVTTVKAQKRNFPVNLQGNGLVTPLNSVDLRSQVTSTVARVHFSDGDFVRAGQLLFTLDSRTDEANLAKAKEQLSYAVLKADYAGVVTAASAEIGQTVSPGQPIVTIAEPTRRDAVIDAPTQFADALWIGSPFKVTLQLDPSVSADGAVREMAPQADDATRTRRIKIALDNPPTSFRLGATIFARPVAGAGAAIRIPASALLQEGDKTFVFVVDPQSLKASLRAVEVAPDIDERWIVRGGLKAGERVVTAGVHRLEDGQVVRIDGSDAP